MRLNSLNKFILCSAVACAPLAHAVDDSMSAQKKIDNAAAKSQQKIDRYSEQETSDLLEYRAVSAQLESLTIFNQQMQKLIDSQEAEKVSINKQIKEIDSIETGALPLMLKMTETLSTLIDADVPFLIDERKERYENLAELIDQANVSAGEKFRRIMEAYQIEMDFGNTIEAYRGDLVVSDSAEPRSVDFLRIGRVGLYYQTLDGKESGRWNPETRSWEELTSSHRIAIRDGIRIARKQMPPELLTLPVSAPNS